MKKRASNFMYNTKFTFTFIFLPHDFVMYSARCHPSSVREQNDHFVWWAHILQSSLFQHGD